MLSNALPLLLLLACTLSTTKAEALVASEPYDNRFSLPHLTDDQNQLETANLDGVSHTANHGSQVVFLPTTKLNVDGGSAITDKDKVQKHGHFDSVPLPVESPTKSFWLDTPGANPLAEEGSTAELARDADVCVIGSGITGVSAAWHLSKLLGDSTTRNGSGEEVERQRSVVILEARRFCSGATGRNGGHLTPIIFQSFSALQSRYNTSEALKSFALEAYTADALVRFIKDNQLEDEVDLVEGGHLTLLRNEVEEGNARRDWEGVKNAGRVDPEGRVEWIGNEELSKKYHVDSKLGYSAVHQRGHNLWPCKVVTHLFKDAQSSSSNLTNQRASVSVTLHTKTPVTSITKLAKDKLESDSASQFQHQSSSRGNDLQRRWGLHTPRGTVDCAYVVHATNGYAAHLLPFLSGIEQDADSLVEYGLNEKPGSIPSSAHHAEEQIPIESSQSQTEDALLPRGAYGIKPTRGQVGAVRASVNASALGWLTSWGNGGDEYWFPRYQDADIDVGNSTTDTGPEGKGRGRGKNPLIMLGGGRYASDDTKEVGIWDDSRLNPSVSKAIRAYLPVLFPEQFIKDGEWEIEWSGVMAYTKSGDPFVGPVRQIQVATNDDKDQSENQYDGQYISAGYSGHGMPRAYACAEAVAGMIAAQIQGKDWKAPGWLPERYLTWATKP